MTATLRCTGSNRRKYHAERTEPDGTKTGACMDCDGRFPLKWEGRAIGVFILKPHEPYVATAVRQALSETVPPETAVRHLRQIAEKATLDPCPDDCICRDPENPF